MFKHMMLYASLGVVDIYTPRAGCPWVYHVPYACGEEWGINENVATSRTRHWRLQLLCIPRLCLCCWGISHTRHKSKARPAWCLHAWGSMKALVLKTSSHPVQTSVSVSCSICLWRRIWDSWRRCHIQHKAWTCAAVKPCAWCGSTTGN